MRRILFLVIFGLSGLAVLLALGSWQMRRLDWKQAVLAEIETRIATAPAPLPDAADPHKDRYMPVIVQGVMEPDELHVLVSRKQIGAGYRIISAFTQADGRRIMIDRGFTAAENKAAPRRMGPMQVTGNLHWPEEIDGYTPDPDIDGNIWFARDVPAMAAALGTDPLLVVAKSQTDPNVTPLPVDTAGIPNDHLQYAITWFSLAVVWAAMTAYFLWRSRARPDEGQNR